MTSCHCILSLLADDLLISSSISFNIESTGLTSDSQVSLKEWLATSLTYIELRKMNEYLLKLERQKAEAMEFFVSVTVAFRLC